MTVFVIIFLHRPLLLDRTRYAWRARGKGNARRDRIDGNVVDEDFADEVKGGNNEEILAGGAISGSLRGVLAFRGDARSSSNV